MQVKVAPVSSTNLNGPWPLIFTGTMIAASLGGASSNGTSPGTVDAGVPKSFEAGSVQADAISNSANKEKSRRSMLVIIGELSSQAGIIFSSPGPGRQG